MILNSTEPAEIRKFGLIALIFFGTLCTVGALTQKPVPTILFGCLAALGITFIFLPARMSPVYLRWIRFSKFLAKAFTVLVLSMAYYLVITPAALIKRIIGGRPLPMKPDKNLSSYWVARSEPAQPLERFSKRY
jgi:hypothetical protein